MKISAKAEYACLAMLALARHRAESPPLRIREISESSAIPERYLVQILLQLKAAGLVASTRGASGGYRLARDASSISLSDVLIAIEGPDATGRDHSATRPTASSALEIVWERVRAAERAVLDATTIAQLAQESSPHEWVI
jgi:Rrf2 family protein